MKYTYIILFSLLVGCLGIGLSIHGRTNWLKDFSLDIASEIVGILLVIFAVDRVIDAERNRRKKRKELVAIQQLENTLIKHIYMLNEITKDDQKITYESPKDTLIYLQQKSLQDVISIMRDQHFSSKILGNFARLSTEIDNFRKLSNGILEKYSYFLSAEQIHTIERTVNDPLILLLEQAKEQGSSDEENNDNNSLKIELSEEDFKKIFEDYLNQLFQLAEIYNNNSNSINN